MCNWKTQNNNGLNKIEVISLSYETSPEAGSAELVRHLHALIKEPSELSPSSACGFILKVTSWFKMATGAPPLMLIFQAGNRRKQKKTKVFLQMEWVLLKQYSKNAMNHPLTDFWPEHSHRTMSSCNGGLGNRGFSWAHCCHKRIRVLLLK